VKVTHFVKTRLWLSTLALVVISQAAATAQAGAFEKVLVEGARCSDGSAYPVYLRQGDPEKVLVFFEGGGACWDAATCFGPVPFTFHKDRESPLEDRILLLKDSELHGFKDYSLLFIPYCTGDVFVGRHVAHYGKKTVNHLGRLNLEKALDQIEDAYGLLGRAREVVAYGESAGAIGVVANVDLLEARTHPEASKSAFVDSAGLHFAKSIWGRFSDEYLDDLRTGMARNGVDLDFSTGKLAPQMLDYCSFHSKWKVGFLQGAQDVIMSWIFGAITGPHHRARVYGKEGLWQQLRDPMDNCSSWTPDTGRHVLLSDEKGWNAKTKDGVSGGDFVKGILAKRAGESQTSHR
jgi:hypothetical protein